jgi:hypothetical protein
MNHRGKSLMVEKTEKFSEISEIFTQFTEKNMEKLLRIATNLLKAQKENEEIVANAISHETGKGCKTT